MIQMNKKPKGKLIIIGGHENKDHCRQILEMVAKQVSGGPLVIITVATQMPQEVAGEYISLFQELGVKDVQALDIRIRADAQDEANVQLCAKASVLFFTGGDQLRITSQMGDSPLYQCVVDNYQKGMTVVGTSAGAAAMPETMLVSGPGDESNRVSALNMAPGLGLIEGVVIDSHFAERGRMGRLLGAVAQNPRNLGIGIDEDTAIIVEHGKEFRVLGSGAVYVVDGATVTYSSLSEQHSENIVSIYNTTLHVLGDGDCFELETRQPFIAEASKRKLGSVDN
jgi:cyanophycinase